MTIMWFCIPAHGHTNPTLGLVKALTDAGHTIYYFSYEMFRGKIESAGAVFYSCDEFSFEEQDKDYADKIGKDQAFAVKLMVSATLGLDAMVSEKIKELEPDVIVSDSVAFWGKLAALKFKIPYICSTTTFAFNRYSGKPWAQIPIILIIYRTIFRFTRVWIRWQYCPFQMHLLHIAV